MISWSCEVGPTIAGEPIEPFSLYASKIGLAFQIIDDILDVTSSSKSLGKKVITVRWIDINKGDAVDTNYTSRLVARESETEVRPDLFAATPF